MFLNVQQTKQFEAMGVFQSKLSSSSGFPSFSQLIQALLQKLQWALSVWKAPQEQIVCLSFHQSAEMNLSPSGQQHMACSDISKFPSSTGSWTTCSVGCESRSWHAAATWILLNHWFSLKDVSQMPMTAGSWELPEAKDHLAQTSLLLGLNSPKRISPRILLGLSWLSQPYEKRLMCFPYLLQAPKKTALCVSLSMQSF